MHLRSVKPGQPPLIAQTTVERRTVLRWLGNATVLAFGGDVLSACLGTSIADSQRPNAGAGNADGAAEAAGASVFDFQPGSGTDPIFDDWYENTVDAQNLVDILAGWTLTVDGMVSNPLSLRFVDLIALDRQDQVTDFHCVEGWSVLDVPWNGLPLASALDLAGADASATYLSFYSVGGEYSESLPISVAREPHTLLGYGVGGSTLPLAHGFPVRLVVPRLYGYKNAKYLSRIEVTDHAVTGYWEAYGYPYAGEIPASLLRPGKY
jgi:DMSO/TMAO reductase YedYZ molybdopterin-dependent catalytic subunit